MDIISFDVITRFFECDVSRYDIKRCRMLLVGDNGRDILPIDFLHNSVIIAKIGDKYVLKVWLDSETIKELQDQTGCADPLSLEAVQILGITESYIGPTIHHVTGRYPELRGSYVSGTDESGVNILTLKIKEIN